MHNSIADHSAIGVEGGAGQAQVFFIRLQSRKTAPQGVCLRRQCSCKPGLPPATLCPVHAFERFMKWQGSRRFGRVFPGFQLRSFQRVLRVYLERIGEHELAASATSHGFRRGSAQELLRAKTPMARILQAGGWKSPAFLEYLEKEDIDSEAVLELCCEFDTSESVPAKPPRAAKVCPSTQWGDIRSFLSSKSQTSRVLPDWMLET